MVNRHFAETDFQHDGSYQPPTRLYGSLDHIERGDQSTLAAFDCVDADWFDRQRSDPVYGGYFDSSDPQAAEDLWRDFWKAAQAPGHTPLDGMPVFRIEVELPALSQLTMSGYGRGAEDGDDELALAELTWLEFTVAVQAMPSSFQAQFYHGMFLPPNTFFITASELTDASKAKTVLNLMMTSLNHLSAPTANDLKTMLGAASADYLGVWDVGQGNVNVLLDASCRATAYFDLGCGVYRNAWTRPTNLEFCWGGNAAIVLSHWDADHWGGAQVATAARTKPALGRDWIVPVQKVTMVHLTFAASIAASGHLWRLSTRTVVSIGGGRQVTLQLGRGSSRNHSGIVMLVENGTTGADAWLLTGDCDYKHVASMPSHVVALVAPHHGATLAPKSTPSAPAAASYHRLIYSFGANNAHGKATSHPTPAGVKTHDSVGWLHGTWTPPATPAFLVAGADVLATAQHMPGVSRTHPPPASARLGGAFIGWTAPLAPWTHCPGCAGTCAPPLPQT